MQKLMELRGTTIKSFTLGMPEFEERLDKGIRQACRILDFNGVADIFCKQGHTIEEDGPVSLLCWRWFFLFSIRPVIVLNQTSVEADYDTLGVSVLNNMVHVKQGLWKTIKETIIEYFNVNWRNFPPFEKDAFEMSVNLWWDQKTVEAK